MNMPFSSAHITRGLHSLLVLSALLLTGCWNWHRYPWYEFPSPDGEHIAVINMETGGIGGFTTVVRIRPTRDQKAQLAYKIHGCPILNVFWLDNNHLEVQLTPRIHPCTYREGTTFAVDRFRVSVTMPRSTAKADIRGTIP